MSNEPAAYQHSTSQEQPAPAPTVRPQFWKYVLTALITVLLTFSLTAGIGILLFIGYTNSGSGAGDGLGIRFAEDAATKAALAKLQTVYQEVDQNFYKDLTDAEMLEAMTRGLVDELGNRYTMYLTAEQNKQIEESMSGNYSGIGAIVFLNKDNQVEITDIVEASPAEEAGLLVGDIFVAVDGKEVSGITDISSLAALVRGTEGTKVTLVVYRPSAAKNITVTATRRKIANINVASRMLEPGLGYVQIRDFSSGVAANFKKAVDSLQAQGARNIVFDLRNNTGGLADEVIQMLDYLLPKATIASIKGRDSGKPFERTWSSEASSGVPADMRYAILINGMSASASELFSGCLRDNGKAYLIGEQSFGKGSGTITIPLSDGSAINLTNFLYYLPKGESIEEVGLTPDQAVSLPDAASGTAISRLTLDLDTQLKAAIDYLKGLK